MPYLLRRKSLKRLSVNLKDNRDYPIFIGENLFEGITALIKPFSKASKFMVVTNEKVHSLFASRLNIENASYFLIPDGEQFKNFDTYKNILDEAVRLKLKRTDAIIALGGGVIGDIAGFAASTYMRGIDYIQIPTTLLAQVDSSVGGKVAINHSKGKNLIGAFYQPKIVIADINTLDSLDERQIKTGLGEVLKYALIEKSIKANKNYDFFHYLLTGEQDFSKIVEICCALKSSIVERDEKENGLRAILNFGHTFAHAIEESTDYVHFTHGEAVSMGMKMALKLSLNLKLIDESYYDLCLKLLDVWGLNLSFEPDKDRMLEAMILDKKTVSDGLRFVLAEGFARVAMYQGIDTEDIKMAMDF